MLFAQALLILSCFYAFFGIIRDRKRFLLISIMGLSFSLMTVFNISIRINNLLVDFLLPLLALAVLSILYTYRDHLFKACIVTTPIMGLLSIVKNSGLFFYAICIVCLMYYVIKSFKKTKIKQNVKLFFASLVTIAFSILPYIVWNLHTKIGLQGTLSKHTLSVENFQEVSSEKSAETIRLIIDRFFEAIFSFDSLSTRGILLFHFLMIASYLITFIVLKKRWNSLKVLLLLDIGVVLYYIGNLAMFIYTMPTEEALVLAGLERYLSSMVLFFIGIVTFNIIINIENSLHVQQGAKRDYKAFKNIRTKQLYQNTALICTAIGLSFLFSEINGMNSMNQDYSTSVPGRVTSLVGDQMTLNTQDKFLVYAEDTDGQVTNFNLQYAAKYFLFSANVTGISSFTEEDMNLLDAYDYVLIMDENTQLTSAIERTTSEDSLAGLYKINHQKLTKVPFSDTVDFASR
ncbi:hypothetical protein ACFP65_10035 [Marinilactibacillus sp. GCM10026970]|uniref:hypothetical protein n=1 Tax=Marinilactibacillus sp. GCM10026970 TaxID=3252642 RepID=UPI00360EADBB